MRRARRRMDRSHGSQPRDGHGRGPVQPGGPVRGRAMLGIALALGSSVAWGISDFLGGLQSRRISAITVLLVSQPVGLVLALVFALVAGGDSLSARDAAIAVGAGATVVL